MIRILWAERLKPKKPSKRLSWEGLLWQTFLNFPVQGVWVPAVDIFEVRQALLVVISCPGAQRDSFEIRLDGRFLYVKGHRSAPLERGRVYQLEGEYGPFERLIELPVPVSPEGAEATFEEGLLRILLPKSPFS